MSQKVTQNFTRIDMNNLTPEQNQFFEDLQALLPQINKPMVADTTQTLELNLIAGVRSLTYVSSRAYLTTGEEVYYWITQEHARALAQILRNSQLHFFELMLTTWAPGAFQIFVDELRQGDVFIENLLINHISGDEFNEDAAVLWPEVIEICRCASFKLKNNEFTDELVSRFAQVLSLSENTNLINLDFFPFPDDSRGPGPLDFKALAPFRQVLRDDKGPAVDDSQFNDMMNLVSSMFDEELFEFCISYCNYFADGFELDGQKLGWLFYYRHKCWYAGKNPDHFKLAVTFLRQPGRIFMVGHRNMLWMLSTAGEMSFSLKEADLLQHFLNSYEKANGVDPDDPEAIRNSVRHFSNSYYYWKDLARSDKKEDAEKKLLETLKKHPEVIKEFKTIPKEVLDKMQSH